MKIAVAGTGYVGLSIATLLSQHHEVMAVDIIPEKVDLINHKKSPIQDEYIEKYLAEKDLNLTATLNAEAAYKDADFVVIAAPTNYDSKKNLPLRLKQLSSWLFSIIRMLSWSSSLRFRLALQLLFVRNTTVITSSSVRSSCVSRRLCTTTCTRAVSLWVLMWITHVW